MSGDEPWRIDVDEAEASARSTHSWLWLLPAAFIVHDAEEFVTRPAWIAAHGETLNALLANLLGSSGPQLLEASGRLTTGIAMLVLLVIFVIVTAAADLFPHRRAASYAYLIMLGAFSVHALGHFVQTIAFGDYTPGVVTALLVAVPVSVILYRRLQTAGRVNRTAMILTACLGAVLIVPGIIFALSMATGLAG